MKKILIVDDERPFLESLQDGIATYSDQLNVICANNGQEALAVLKKEKIDLLVTDLHMPVMDGFELLAHVSKQDPYLPVIVMTAFGTPEIEEKIANMMAFHYLEKPLDLTPSPKRLNRPCRTMRVALFAASPCRLSCRWSTWRKRVVP